MRKAEQLSILVHDSLNTFNFTHLVDSQTKFIMTQMKREEQFLKCLVRTQIGIHRSTKRCMVGAGRMDFRRKQIYK